MSSRLIGTLVVALAVLSAVGCQDRKLRPLNPCTISGSSTSVPVTAVDDVDLLFQIDTSDSMLEEQDLISQQLPTIFTVLSTGDLGPGSDGNGNGVFTEIGDDFPPPATIQFGVITTDMGTDSWGPITGCDDAPELGDDGRLQFNRGTSMVGGMACDPSIPGGAHFLTFMSGNDPAQFAHDASCLAIRGGGGCGFEQQLEGVLKAVTPTSSSLTFVGGTHGHMGPVGGSQPNAGFVRPEALLAIIMVTDEEDCSAANTDLFNVFNSATTDGLNANLTCWVNGGSYPGRASMLHPTSRYVDNLLALKPPSQLIFAAIAGVGPNLESTDPGVTFDTILNDASMVETHDGVSDSLEPSCTYMTNVAFPPRRIVETARGLSNAGVTSLVASICQADFSGPVQRILTAIGQALAKPCLPRALNRDSFGAVRCEVREELPVGSLCSSFLNAGREYYQTVERFDGMHEVCNVAQIVATGAPPPASAGAGFYYDDFSADATDCETPTRTGQVIQFTTGAEPIPGSTVSSDCIQPIASGSDAVTDPEIHVLCDPTNAAHCVLSTDAAAAFAGRHGIDNLATRTAPILFCETTTNTCQVGCESDADCPGGFVCYNEENIGNLDLAIPPMSFCVNPVCR